MPPLSSYHTSFSVSCYALITTGESYGGAYVPQVSSRLTLHHHHDLISQQYDQCDHIYPLCLLLFFLFLISTNVVDMMFHVWTCRSLHTRLSEEAMVVLLASSKV